MTPSSELHTLIHSMQKKEKAFFKTWSGHQKEKDYILLFDVIEGMQKYDEELVKKKLKGHPVLKRLAPSKNYLLHAVLESLVFQSQKDTLEGELWQEVRSINMLLSRNLSRMAQKMLVKTKKSAITLENFGLVLELLRIEKKMARSLSVTESEKQTIAITRQENEVLKMWENLNAYILLDSKMYNIRRKIIQVRKKEDLKEITDLLKEPLLSDESKALSFEAKHFFYSLKGTCHNLLNEEAKSLVYRKKLSALFKSINILNAERLLRYSSSLFELSVSQRDLGLFDEAIQCIRTIENLWDEYPQFRSFKVESVLFKRSSIIESDVYQYSGNFEKGYLNINKYKSGVNKYGELIERDLELVLYYNIALICFGKGDFKQALSWINKVLYKNEHNYVQDVICFARIFMLFIYIELGDDGLIQHNVHSTLSFLQRRKRLFKSENLTIDFIRKLNAKNFNNNTKEVYAHFYERFKSILNDPYEKNALEYFDFISWFQSKIEKRNFAEVYRENLKYRLAKAK